MTRSLTLLDSGLVDTHTIDRVLQSVVFFSDRVVLRASFEVPAAYRDLASAVGGHPLARKACSELRERVLLDRVGVCPRGRVVAGQAGSAVVIRGGGLMPQSR